MNKMRYFTTNELKPCGWVKNQLEILANGLAGNLDKVWKDVSDSAWIGGECEGWERVPYWLDGFIPLAYLLSNDDMIKRAKKYVDAIINNQQKSGWICPSCADEIDKYDTWAVQLISKTLLTYYECSRDERVPDVLYKLMKNYYDLLSNKKISLFNWGKYRWFESFIALNFLQERYNEPWIIGLAKILREQGVNYLDSVKYWKRSLNKVIMDTHIVNVVMALKSEAVSYDLLNEKYADVAEYLLKTLENYHGTAVNVFTGDEHLGGLSPIRGTELCAVVEQMYSYEQLFLNSGDYKWLDRLEVIAFNALPAALSDDTWAHQYDQLSNQISCERFSGNPVFGTNAKDSNVFGLEPNFGCCTANYCQGWSKFALSSFAFDGNVVLNALPLPCELNADVCNIEVITDYPFKNEITYEIFAKNDFVFKARIPSVGNNVIVNDKPFYGKTLVYNCKRGESKTIKISFSVETQLVNRPNNLKAVKAGSLVFSLPISYEVKKLEYEENGVVRKYPYCDYEYVGTSSWNYALSDFNFTLNVNQVNTVPFSSKIRP